MGKSRVQTRVEPDTEQKINEYAEDRDIGEAEALRRLIRSGLAAEGHPVTAEGGSPIERIAGPRTIQVGTVLVLTSALAMLATNFLLTTGYTTPGILAAGTAVLLLILGTLTVWAAAIAQIVLARPLRNLVIPRWVRA